MPLAADTFSSFTALQSTAGGVSGPVSLHTLPFGESGRHRLAKSSTVHPVLLIETSLPSGAYPAPLKLENLSVLHGYEGRIESGEGTETGIFTVVECHVTEAELVLAFLSLATHLLENLPPMPDPRVVGFELRKLVHIFQALRQPPTKTIQGLWAELFVLANSPDIARWAAAWHDDPTDRYDFAMQRLRVEVKSSGNRIRRHAFSHEQLHPPKGVNLWIASVFVERSSAGSDCAELLSRIQARLNAESAFRIESLVMRTLGLDFERARDFKFDEALAGQSLAFVQVESIPRLTQELPHGVNEVRYSVTIPQEVPIRRGYPHGD